MTTNELYTVFTTDDDDFPNEAHASHNGVRAVCGAGGHTVVFAKDDGRPPYWPLETASHLIC